MRMAKACALALFSVLLLLSPSAFGQCGDADGNQALSIGDVVYDVEYLFNGGPPPVNYELADTDGRQGVTVVEPWMINNCLFGGCFGFTGCQSIGPPIVPEPDSTIRINYHWLIPANLDHFTVHFYLDTDNNSVDAIQLPLRFMVDGVPAKIDSVFQIEEVPFLKGHTISADSTSMIAGRVPLFGGVDGYFLKVFLLLPFSTLERELDVQYASFIPPQAPPEQQYELAPMVISNFGQCVEPVLTKICCQIAGDVDQSGAVSIADAVFIINYTFGGGPTPGDCLSQVDADGSGTISIGDAVFIINYIFGGGSAPTCGS